MDGSHRSLEGWPDAITFRLLRFLSHLFGRVHSCIRRSVRCKRRPKSNLAILGCFDVFDKISITDAVQLLRIANSNAFSVVSHRVTKFYNNTSKLWGFSTLSQRSATE